MCETRQTDIALDMWSLGTNEQKHPSQSNNRTKHRRTQREESSRKKNKASAISVWPSRFVHVSAVSISHMYEGKILLTLTETQ